MCRALAGSASTAAVTVAVVGNGPLSSEQRRMIGASDRVVRPLSDGAAPARHSSWPGSRAPGKQHTHIKGPLDLDSGASAPVGVVGETEATVPMGASEPSQESDPATRASVCCGHARPSTQSTMT